MLGDHQWVRKRNAYEPSARIPFFIRFPDTMGLPQGQCIDRLVDVTDVMPTLLDAVGLPVPETVEGRSVLPLLRGETVWRAYVHGECANITTLNSGMQYLTDGRWKYIWFPALAKEQLFDLATDPREMTDLASDPASMDTLGDWRELLIRELTGRPEGFTDGHTLLRLAGPTADIIGPLSHLP